MNLSAGLRVREDCEVVMVNKGRELDGFGFMTRPDDSTCFFNASVIPAEDDQLALDPDGSVGVKILDIRKAGRIDLKFNDVVRIDGTDFTVRKVEYRTAGRYTYAQVRNITRRGLTA